MFRETQIIASVWVPNGCGTLGMLVSSCGPLSPCLYREGGDHRSPFGLQNSLTFKTQRKECPKWKKMCDNIEIDSGILCICKILFFYPELFL